MNNLRDLKEVSFLYPKFDNFLSMFYTIGIVYGVLYMRSQKEERRNFTYEERQRIFEKSDYRCCHCGQKIKIYREGSTIEHVIPLSKGGTNDLSNLVCLCAKCNENKDNLIIPPYDYYYYINKEYHKELIDLYRNYCNDISYYDRNNFTRDDAKLFTYYNRLASMESKVPKSRKKNYRCGVNIPMQATLKKAFYSDLDEIYEYCIKYHKKFNLPANYLKDVISEVFNEGAFYVLRKGSDIISVIPVSFGVIVMNSGEQYHIVAINGIPSLYAKDIYVPLICDCIHYIMSEISKVDPDGNVVFKIQVPQNDSFGQSIARRLEPSNKSDSNDSLWNTYCYIHTYVQDIPNYEGDDKIDVYRQLRDGDYIDEEKCFAKFSKSMQRIFKLEPLDKEKKRQKTREQFAKTSVKPGKGRKPGRYTKNFTLYDVDEYADIV